MGGFANPAGITEIIHKRTTDRYGYERLLNKHKNHPDFRVRLALIRHYHCRPCDHIHFVKDPAWQVRGALLERKDVDEITYMMVIKDDHWFVEFVARQSPFFKGDLSTTPAEGSEQHTSL